MITKEDALEKAIKYINKRKREYVYIDSIDNVKFEEKKYINYGEYEEKERDIFVINYDIEGYTEPIPHFVVVDAETGKILFTASPHGYVEDWEE